MIRKYLFFIILLLYSPQILLSSNNPTQVREVFFKLPTLTEEQVYFYRIPSNYRQTCKELAENLHISYKVMYNLVLKESDWNSKAINKNKNGTYDIGLTQINSSNFEYFYWKILKKDITKSVNFKSFYLVPETNLKTGMLYLRWLLNYFDQDYYKAVMAYNCGLTKVKRGDIPPSTYNYVHFILNN